MSHIKKNSTRRSDDTMDDDSDDRDSKRKSRNLSEKKRRDQFNLLVNELSSMVSTGGGRKMDKSTVLKSTISFLKKHNEIAVRSRVNEIQEDWKPTFLTNEEFTHLILEAVDGFIIVFSANGKINYASESITSLLGHQPTDLLNMTLYEMASEEEQTNLYNILMHPSEDQGQVSFSCHLRRGGSNNNSYCYELVHFLGYFKSDEDSCQSESRYSGYSGETDTRLYFVGTGRIQTPQLIKEMPLIDSYKSEFTSRHSLEWKFLFLDHRAPPIIGYLPFELLGTSGYDYYHVDDLEKVVTCHDALKQKGEGTSCYYRFLTKGQQWIWLQTRFYITYHQWNSKPEFVVCTHRVVSYSDVLKQRRKDAGIEEPEKFSTGDNIMNLWATNNSTIRTGPESDCTSMSADSPESRHSIVTQYSMKSRASHHIKRHSNPTPQPQQMQHLVPQSNFLEPSQFVASIPVQPVTTNNFAPSAVLSTIPPVMTPAQNQLQADLQKKHAELQAIIGQQQQELRRVSEQLLMARLGISSGSQTQNIPITYHGTNSATVSSTTSSIHGTIVGPSSVIMPVSVPIALPPHQYQNQHLLYNLNDSHCQTNK